MCPLTYSISPISFNHFFTELGYLLLVLHSGLPIVKAKFDIYRYGQPPVTFVLIEYLCELIIKFKKFSALLRGSSEVNCERKNEAENLLLLSPKKLYIYIYLKSLPRFFTSLT